MNGQTQSGLFAARVSWLLDGLPDGLPVCRLLLLLCLLACSLPVFAQRHAIIVGVSQYAGFDGKIDLPGGQADIAMARELIAGLGVDAVNQQILLDQDATRERVVALFREAAATLQPDDQLFVYFSVHGAQIPDSDGDENDGADEVLALYDLALVKSEQGVSLAGILTDDELFELLDDIDAEQKILIVDACNSGTINRGLGNRGQGNSGQGNSGQGNSASDVSVSGKSLRFPSLWHDLDSQQTDSRPATSTSRSIILQDSRADAATGTNFPASQADENSFDELQGSATLVLTATAEKGLAESAPSGSVYTRALYSAFSRPSRIMTPWCLHQSASRSVARSSNNGQQPQFRGSWLAANRLPQNAGDSVPAHTVHKALNNYANCQEMAGLSLQAESTTLSLTDALRLQVTTRKPGRIALLAAHGDTVELFPWPHTAASPIENRPGKNGPAKNLPPLGHTRLLQDENSQFTASGKWNVEFSAGDAMILAMWLPPGLAAADLSTLDYYSMAGMRPEQLIDDLMSLSAAGTVSLTDVLNPSPAVLLLSVDEAAGRSGNKTPGTNEPDKPKK